MQVVLPCPPGHLVRSGDIIIIEDRPRASLVPRPSIGMRLEQARGYSKMVAARQSHAVGLLPVRSQIKVFNY